MICIKCGREIDRSYGAPELAGCYCLLCAKKNGLTEAQIKQKKEKVFNSETIISAIKEVAVAVAENGGAEIKARFFESNGEVLAHIIIEPYRFISKEERSERE